jgi:phenylpyruvate tautomerase PptA (4-oxalocrotonate tautomerase family)
MPLIKVQTSVTAPNKAEIESMLKGLSAKLAKHTGKPEAYVMTAFEAEVPMTFAGNTKPACYIEIKSVGTMKPELTSAMSQDFCQEINQILNVPKNRIYIEFADSKGFMWGWNSTTFG